jgi:hypothetical protein
MAFKKNGETKVYKRGGKVGPKLAAKDKSNRFLIDDLIRQADQNDLSSNVPVVIQEEEEDTEDVSN